MRGVMVCVNKTDRDTEERGLEKPAHLAAERGGLYVESVNSLMHGSRLVCAPTKEEGVKARR